MRERAFEALSRLREAIEEAAYDAERARRLLDLNPDDPEVADLQRKNTLRSDGIASLIDTVARLLQGDSPKGVGEILRAVGDEFVKELTAQQPKSVAIEWESYRNRVIPDRLAVYGILGHNAEGDVTGSFPVNLYPSDRGYVEVTVGVVGQRPLYGQRWEIGDLRFSNTREMSAAAQQITHMGEVVYLVLPDPLEPDRTARESHSIQPGENYFFRTLEGAAVFVRDHVEKNVHLRVSPSRAASMFGIWELEIALPHRNKYPIAITKYYASVKSEAGSGRVNVGNGVAMGGPAKQKDINTVLRALRS